MAEVKTIRISKDNVERYLLRDGDVLLTEGGDYDKLARGCVWRNEISNCLHQNHIFAVRPDQARLLPDFLALLCRSRYKKNYFLGCAKQTTNLASINSTQLKRFPIALPPMELQARICRILGRWRRAEELQDRLVKANRKFKQGLTRNLFAGAKRFPKFVGPKDTLSSQFEQSPVDWPNPSVGHVAKEMNERSRRQDALPVLSCTKHRGLVDSLEYFGKRMFSSDTSNYKIVRRGQFAYATNHIEEGSIGLLDAYDAGLISPIYTVFEVDASRVHAPFLFRLFKTETYRHIFAANMSASVYRRGSLRWSQFAKIQVPLPSLAEQRRIADALDAVDHEIDIMTRQAEALARQKRGLMEKLLTGKIRVKE